MSIIGKAEARAARARAKSVQASAQFQGRKPHPTGVMDANYDADQIAFLVALDAWRRRTLAPAPDAKGLTQVMRSIGYKGNDVPTDRFAEEVGDWRRRQGRRFPPACALLGIMTDRFGFERKEARP